MTNHHIDMSFPKERIIPGHLILWNMVDYTGQVPLRTVQQYNGPDWRVGNSGTEGGIIIQGETKILEFHYHYTQPNSYAPVKYGKGDTRWPVHLAYYMDQDDVVNGIKGIEPHFHKIRIYVK